MTRRADVAERFWAKVAVADCWEWRGGRLRAGYGKFWRDGKTLLAHRVSWELLVGTIPQGLTLDHLCRNRACVNPDHLEPVPMGVNTARSGNRQALAAQKASVTHCPNGHEYATQSRIDHRGLRLCIPCDRARYARQKPKLGKAHGFTVVA